MVSLACRDDLILEFVELEKERQKKTGEKMSQYLQICVMDRNDIL